MPDARGWLWLEPVGLWIGVTQPGGDEAGAAYLYDAEGNLIGDYTSVTRAAAEAEARAAEAEVRLRELEAELRRQRGAE